MGTYANRQLGLSMAGFLMLAVILVFLAIFSLKIIPVYVQDQSIKSQLEEMARDPELKDASAQAIRDVFAKRARVADITNVKAADIDIGKDAGGLTLNVEYSVKVPLAGNASLLFEFKTGSAK